ncbi:MAG TPA: hypothetical protein V6C81_09970 [Planktothrix sp.]
MFQNPLDEDKICSVLKAFLEEWGSENIVVALPREWARYGTESVGGVRFEFSTDNKIAIRAEYNNAVSARYEYELSGMAS